MIHREFYHKYQWDYFVYLLSVTGYGCTFLHQLSLRILLQVYTHDVVAGTLTLDFIVVIKTLPIFLGKISAFLFS